MFSFIVLYSIIGLFIGISQSAGIGGGPVLNICLMIGAGYSAKESMSITYIFLMGGALASIFKNYKKFIPGTRMLAIDYDLILATLPMSASGSLLGTLTNHFLSELAITVLFTFLLSYICYNTYQKLKKANNQQAQCLREKLIDPSIELQNLGAAQKTVSAELEAILEAERDPHPREKIQHVGFMYVFTVLVLLLKGGQHYQSIIGIDQCGFTANLIILAHLLVSYYLTTVSSEKLVEKDRLKQELGYVFENQSDKMSRQKMTSCMVSGFCAGLIGGALGLGGAIILMPIWLGLGMDQTKATSSSAPLILFSALISFTICLLSGRYRDFLSLCFFFVLAFVSSAAVRSLINIIIARYKLKSMLYILLLITMACSLVALVPFQFKNFLVNPQSFMEFGSFC